VGTGGKTHETEKGIQAQRRQKKGKEMTRDRASPGTLKKSMKEKAKERKIRGKKKSGEECSQ